MIIVDVLNSVPRDNHLITNRDVCHVQQANTMTQQLNHVEAVQQDILLIKKECFHVSNVILVRQPRLALPRANSAQVIHYMLAPTLLNVYLTANQAMVLI